MVSAATQTLSEYGRPSRHARSGHFTMLIGYRMRDDGTRVRANWTFGRDESEAIAAAVATPKEWEIVVRDWSQRTRVLQEKLPAFDWSKPVWNDSPPIARLIDQLTHDLTAPDGMFAQATERIRQHAEEDDRENLALIERRSSHLLDKYRPQPGPANPTIEQAKELFLASKLKQVGLAGGRGIKPRTYNGINKMLCAALGLSVNAEKGRVRQVPLDLNKTLCELKTADLREFVDFWMAQPDGIGVRTAASYCQHVKAMLDWCAEEEGLDFVMPRGAAKLFRFRGIHRFTVCEYDPAILKKLMQRATDRVKLYILLGLNCGYYQQDISDLRHEDLVQHNGEWCLWRGRSKTTHQNDFETLHWLWPDTHLLLAAESARVGNRWGRLLLNKFGEPLVREAVGQAHTDLIGHNYRKLCGKAGVQLSFRQLRKLVWNQIKHLSGGSTDLARKYAGQTVGGVARHYDKNDFSDLTLMLKRWYDQLKADGVL